MLEAAVTDDWRSMLGRFHGGLAWLPVGLLAAVAVAEFVAFVQRDAGSRLLRTALWITTALAAAAAAISGWLLADASGAVAAAAAGVDETARRHRALGIALVGVLALVAVADVATPRRGRLAAAVARTGGLGAAAGLLAVTTLLGVTMSRGAVPMADAVPAPLQPAADALARLAAEPETPREPEPRRGPDASGGAAPPAATTGAAARPLARPADTAAAAGTASPPPDAAPVPPASTGTPPAPRGVHLVALAPPAPPWHPDAAPVDRPVPLRAEVDAAALDAGSLALLRRLAPRIVELVVTGGDGFAWAEVPRLSAVTTLRIDDPTADSGDAAVVLRRVPWVEQVLLHETAVDAKLTRPLLGLPALASVTVWGTDLDAPRVRAAFAAVAPSVELVGAGSPPASPFGDPAADRPVARD